MRRYEGPHPGIRIDKIPVSGGAGLVFAAGAVTILLAVPELREVLLATLVGGGAVAGWLYFWHRQTRW